MYISAQPAVITSEVHHEDGCNRADRNTEWKGRACLIVSVHGQFGGKVWAISVIKEEGMCGKDWIISVINICYIRTGSFQSRGV